MEKTQQSWGKMTILGFQHVLAMFGATVLVPMLTGLPISVALFGAGVGTIIFHLVTKRKVPVFVGSSFAFIAAIQATVIQHAEGLDMSNGLNVQDPAYQEALPYALGGIMVAGALYLVLSLLVKIFGPEKVRGFFPPIVTGSIIIIIGLMLAPIAIGNITKVPEGGSLAINWLIAGITIISIMVISIFTKGFFKLVPILFGIIIGYAVSLIVTATGTPMVNTAGIAERAFFEVPQFMFPKFSWLSVATIAPIAIVTFVEHLGDINANGAVVGQDFIKDPGLHRTLMGDGLATMFAGLIGAPANTTYSENTGVLAATRNYNPQTLRIAAVFAIVLSFFGKFSGALSSMPGPVMGGVSVILFGMIASVGLRTLVENNVDFKKSRNLMIVAVMLVLGLGGAAFQISEQITISGVALSAIVGIVLNKVLPEKIDRNGDAK